MYGCRVIQKALEFIPSDQQVIVSFPGSLQTCYSGEHRRNLNNINNFPTAFVIKGGRPINTRTHLSPVESSFHLIIKHDRPSFSLLLAARVRARPPVSQMTHLKHRLAWHEHARCAVPYSQKHSSAFLTSNILAFFFCYFYSAVACTDGGYGVENWPHIVYQFQSKYFLSV